MGLNELLIQDWFTLLQSAGIIGSLLFAALSYRDSYKARQVSTLIEITQNHREIWQHLLFQPTTSRVSSQDVDLTLHPITESERLIVRLLVLHLNTTYEALRHSSLRSMEGISADIKRFFGTPIPRAVWNESREFHNADFVEFVERNF